MWPFVNILEYTEKIVHKTVLHISFYAGVIKIELTLDHVDHSGMVIMFS